MKNCKHPRITTWRIEATGEPAGLWSCAECNVKFVPFTQMLAEVAAERERCAAICEQRSADHWHDYKDRASPHRGDSRTEGMSDEAEECAKAIRNPCQT